MKEFIKSILIQLYRMMTRFIPVSNNIIIFQASNGKNYTGNPRFIYEEAVRSGLDKKYECVWFLLDVSTEVPGKCRKVRNNYLKYFWYLMRAGVWIFDSRQPLYYIKKRNVVFLQTWHGTPLKKLALDMEKLDLNGSSDIEDYHRQFLKTTKDWDFLISQNRFASDVFRSCFSYDNKEILEIGYPRNDILLREWNEEKTRKLKESLGLPLDRKIILYAPTWRDNEFRGDGDFVFATNMDFARMREALKYEYVMIVKYHYLVSAEIDWSPYSDFVYTFDETKDIAFLYLAADLLITDYSSVMFDYSLLRRPMLFFAYDLDNYRENLRGFYFDFLDEVPGPISRDTEQLIEDIEHYADKEWTEKYDAFTKKYHQFETGTASRQVLKTLGLE